MNHPLTLRWNPMRTLPLHARQQPPDSRRFKSKETKSNFIVWLLTSGSSSLCLWKLKFKKSKSVFFIRL